MLAHGADAKRVYDEAREQGITSPYPERISPKQQAYVGDWRIVVRFELRRRRSLISARGSRNENPGDQHIKRKVSNPEKGSVVGEPLSGLFAI
jgi:hypothetical protein